MSFVRYVLFGDLFVTRLTILVSMPDLIAHTNMDSQGVSRLREELHKMTQWLSKNAGNYLSQEYEQPTQDYIDRVK